MSGRGIAKGYTWSEEAFEIEVTVPVPANTKAKDISFRVLPTSIELKLLKHGGGGGGNDNDDDDDIILLDPKRALRGRVVVDGTYWVISDAETDEIDYNNNNNNTGHGGRQVTVTIEKQIRQARDDFDVVDYDWNGVYLTEEEGEVSYRKYDEPEELDVREYAASLGVDIDNINMSLVDKTMFTSGLNLTKSSMDNLQQSGLMQEVTQQSDGSEWIMDDDSGERIPFSTMGKGVTIDEVRRGQGLQQTGTKQDDDNDNDNDNDDDDQTAEDSPGPTIPFLDTDSPWHTAATSVVDSKDGGSVYSTVKEEDEDNNNNKTKKEKNKAIKKKQLKDKREKDAVDPIATLTVARLREILRSRGLKVSGNKRELQDRLRSEVQSMMMLGEEEEEKEKREENNAEDNDL